MSVEKDLSCSVVSNQMSTPIITMNTKESSESLDSKELSDSKIIVNIGSMIQSTYDAKQKEVNERFSDLCVKLRDTAVAKQNEWLDLMKINGKTSYTWSELGLTEMSTLIEQLSPTHLMKFQEFTRDNLGLNSSIHGISTHSGNANAINAINAPHARQQMCFLCACLALVLVVSLAVGGFFSGIFGKD